MEIKIKSDPAELKNDLLLSPLSPNSSVNGSSQIIWREFIPRDRNKYENEGCKWKLRLPLFPKFSPVQKPLEPLEVATTARTIER